MCLKLFFLELVLRWYETPCNIFKDDSILKNNYNHCFSRDLIGYFLHGRHQIIPVANEIVRFQSRKCSIHIYLCVFFVLIGVACNLRFNVRVLKGSGKEEDKKYKKGYSTKYCKWFYRESLEIKKLRSVSDVT